MKTGADFQNKWFEETKKDLEEMRARNPIEEDIKLIEQKHQELEEKISELEDRSRRNNLRFSGFTEKAAGAETREESENLIRDFIEENLEMESKDITRTKMLSLANVDKNNSGRTIFTLMRIIVSVQQN